MKMTFQIFQILLAQVDIKKKTLFQTFKGRDFVKHSIFTGPFMFFGHFPTQPTFLNLSLA